jgi:hypothetical protein
MLFVFFFFSMQHFFVRGLSIASLWILSSGAAFAHEHQTFTIGTSTYQFVVGSIGEPVVIDDKSGVEVTVTQVSGPPTMSADGDRDGPSGRPVLGLEKTLQVEIGAGDQKKILPLQTQYGKPGVYSATFIPTVQTTYRYRFFGTVNAVPVDFTFTCNPAGHPQTADDTTPLQLSAGVTRTLKGGAFGCPLAKAELGFPEPAPTLQDLRSNGESASGMVGALSGVLALVLSAWAWVRAGKRTV